MQSAPKFQPEKKAAAKPKTFGVYFGGIAASPTPDEIRVLTQWEMIIVDPRQDGIFEALSSLTNSPKSVVGRIDIADLSASMAETTMLKTVTVITEAIIQNMGPREGGLTPYNGVVISNWDESITPGVCNEIIAFLRGLNLNVYNEIRAPRFMDSRNSNIDVDQLAGMVFLNGSILPNGDRRDYFDLLPMKSALEIVTAQSCLREFAVVMYEVVDDGVYLTNAVVKRSCTWCSFYGAVAWIGTQSALKDARINFPVTSPDGAF